jgi:F-type H+-transporting ATPase subunit delta
MAAKNKAAQQLARQLFTLSLVDDVVSPEHVEGVLAYLEKNPPAEPLAVLQAYRQLVARQLAKSHAVVEHAGPVSEGVLRSIEGALTQKYKRQITATAQHNAELIAGLRMRIGDDVYESSVAGQLQQLAAL